MKTKTAIFFLVIIFAAVSIFSGCDAHNSIDGRALLRIHIRAASNSDADQAVKMQVKEAIVELLEDGLSDVTTLDEALSVVESKLPEIERTASAVLRQNGFDYGASARLAREQFPTRAYEDIVVPSGVYDALILELGGGTGDNWWCVIYPPLCFVRPSYGGDFKYKFKLKELWERYVK